ncbi:MAG: MFS transporter [Clostridiales bacterium]|nr:MFS transporter [Clostridiales bacterium]
MANLDINIVNVALPTIAGQFSASISTMQWVVTAYLLTTSSTMAVFGRLADIIGRKKVYTAGFLVFITGSLLCGLSKGIWFLIAMRVLQAVGAAMLTANSSAIITATFPSKERGRAMGIVVTAVALGSLIGPSVGGFLIGFTNWHFIFYINVPLGLAAFFLGHFIIPADVPAKEKESFDFKGALLFSAGIVTLIFGIGNGESWGWSNPYIYSSIVCGIVLLALFGFVEIKVRYPMIDLSLFRIRPFLVGNIASWLCFVVTSANTMLMPFYLQQILDYTPSQVGLLMTVMPVVMAIIAPISGLASDKFGPLALTTSGLAAAGLSMLYFSFFTPQTRFYQIIPGLVILGVSIGLFQSPNNSSLMGSVPTNKLGISGGINSVVRHFGMVSGTALSVILFQAWGGTTIPGPDQKADFMSAYHSIMLVLMTIAFVAAIISLNRKSHEKVTA